MLSAEIAILQGVRDILRAKLGLDELQCNCEPDEQVPAIAGDYYYAVIPGGVVPGPTHNTSGGVIDMIHSVQVLAVHRKLEPRDRSRVFLDSLTSINKMIGNIQKAIDWQWDALSYINHMLYLQDPYAAPFIQGGIPRVTRIDPKPRPVNSQLYGGQAIGGKGSTPYIGMSRSIYFGGMRRISTIAQLGVGEAVS